jgi:serine/threonine protein kinase/WD40 repeat protein
MNDRQVPDTIGVSLDSRESLRRASKNLTLIEIPGYKLTQELGRGSFGTVWKAEREKTGQVVAVKIVEQSEGLNWDYFRRELDFLREIEEHPHTLTILDAQLESSPPYIVMPLAEGGSLEQASRDAIPDLKQAQKWMWQMAEALAFIHSKGVIHCDFKPSNVLLSSGEDVRIADLGQARRSGHGLALGTIGFMAPEQCEEKTRSSPSVSWDVYAFGATMYWLLTGRIPRLAGLKEPNLAEYLKAVNQNPLEPIQTLNPQVDAELAALVESCLDPNPARRLPSMDAILADLERRRRNEPLFCRRPWRLGYLLRVALKRKGVQLALGLSLLVVLAISAAWESRNENRFLTLSTNGIHAHESGRLEEAYLNWLEAKDFRPKDLATNQRLKFMSLDRLFPHRDRVNDLVLTDQGTLIAASADGEVAFWDTADGQRVASLQHPAHVSQLVLSPDGKLLATASWDGKARTFLVDSKEFQKEFSHQRADFVPSVTALAFCDKGKLLATADVQARVKVWNVETGQEKILKDFQPDLEVRQVLATHPTHPLLAALTSPNTIGLWNMATGDKLPFSCAHQAEVNALQFSKDGRFLMSASDDQTLSVWDVESGARVRTLPHQARVNTFALVSETQLVSGCQDGTATLWDLTADEPLQTFYHRRPVQALGLDTESGLLAVGTGEVDNLWSDTEPNGTVQVWDLATAMPVAGPWPHDGPVEKVTFGEGNTVYSASGSARQTTAVYPGAVRAWRYFLPRTEQTKDSTPVEPSWPSGVKLSNGVTLSHGENVAVNSYASNSKRGITATASEDRTVRLWNTQTGIEVFQPILLNGPVKAVAFDPRGILLATASQETPSSSVVRLWEVESNYPTTPYFSCPGLVRKLKFSSDGKALQAFTENTMYTWPLEASFPDDFSAQVRERLHAMLNARGEVVSESVLSEPVMTPIEP